jgi:hypothetical protein
MGTHRHTEANKEKGQLIAYIVKVKGGDLQTPVAFKSVSRETPSI